MGKYMSIIVGAVVALIGLLLFARWWWSFQVVVKGMAPAMMIFGGAIAVIAGLSELKDEGAAATEGKKEEKK